MGTRRKRRERFVCTIWLPCTSSSLVYSPVCATCRSIVNSHFLVCFCSLLPCASVVDLAFDVMLIYAKRVPSAGSCLKEVPGLILHTYSVCVCTPTLAVALRPNRRSDRASSGWTCLAFFSLELLLSKYFCLHFAYFKDHRAHRADRQSINQRTYQSKCSILLKGNFVV